MKQEISQSMKKEWLIFKPRGFSSVEIILASSIFALIVSALVGTFLYGQEATRIAGERSRAIMLAEEGLEVARNIRDDSYSSLTVGTHGIATSSNLWTLSGSEDVLDTFTRQINITPVDSKRNQITSTVTWEQGPQRNGTTTLVTYLTNWQAGVAQPIPIIPETSVDLPGVADGFEIDLYQSGASTYAVVGRRRSSDKELYIIDVTDPSTPTVVGTLEIGADVNGVTVIGSYAYLATASNTAELQVIDISTPSSPVLAGSLDLSGVTDAEAIVGSGDNVYIGRVNSAAAPEIYSISVSTPSSPTLLSTLEIGSSVWKVDLGGDNTYLYTATGSDSKELVVVDVSNPSSISETGSLDVSGVSDGTAVVSFSSYVALGLGDGNLKIVDISTPSSPTIISSTFDVGAKIDDLAMGLGDAYIFVGSGTINGEVTVVSVSDPTTPTTYYMIDLVGNEALGLVWDPDLNRVFGVSSGNTQEFFVIKP